MIADAAKRGGLMVSGRSAGVLEAHGSYQSSSLGQLSPDSFQRAAIGGVVRKYSPQRAVRYDSYCREVAISHADGAIVSCLIEGLSADGCECRRRSGASM
jgi:hypothetical protein